METKLPKTKQNKKTHAKLTLKKAKIEWVPKETKEEKGKIKCWAPLLASQVSPQDKSWFISNNALILADKSTLYHIALMILIFPILLSFCPLAYHSTWHFTILTGKITFKFFTFSLALALSMFLWHSHILTLGKGLNIGIFGQTLPGYSLHPQTFS